MRAGCTDWPMGLGALGWGFGSVLHHPVLPPHPSGMLRHMRHQQLWRAVGTHYGPTRIYGPAGHAIGGTVQQSRRSFYRSYRSQAMQLADEDRSDAVRRDRRLRDRRERADASVREHGTQRAVQVNSTLHALGIYYSD